jgi:diketogulonate reductase-like aldo/keto reductase
MHRRRALGFLAATAATPACRLFAQPTSVPSSPILRAIPSSGERIPAIGVGSWITFDVPPGTATEAPLIPVAKTFFERGGRMIDSSPMYGYSEAVIGDLLTETSTRPKLFAATKIWTPLAANGRRQFEQSLKLWGIPRFDVIYIHNLLAWEAHYDYVRELKAAGRARYIGVTTSEGNKHDEMERALTRASFDFVQLTYNFADRRIEERLLPLAVERNLAVVINRPFDFGALFRAVGDRPLPSYASEIDCANWAQFFLKFVISHPAVTCAIPATSKAPHMAENIGALYGRLPDAALRRRMIADVAAS